MSDDFTYEPAKDFDGDRLGILFGEVCYLQPDEDVPADFEPLYRRVPSIPSQGESGEQA